MNDEQKYKRPMVISIIVLIIAIVGLVYYYSTNLSLTPEQKAEKEILDYYADLEEQYKNDTFGGETPEETLELFIAALEAEDIELASKYFLPDERGEVAQLLRNERDVGGTFDHVVTGLKELERTEGNHDQTKIAFFIITDKNNVVVNQVVLKKNQNNIWKITSL